MMFRKIYQNKTVLAESSRNEQPNKIATKSAREIKKKERTILLPEQYIILSLLLKYFTLLSILRVPS